jgi:YD repeat-containing protein
VTDPALGVTQYAYNGLDALTQVSDPRSLATAYSVDGLGNLTQQSSPDTGATVNTYDAAGNLLTQTDAKNQVTSYAYDALNRVTRIRDHAGNTVTRALFAPRLAVVDLLGMRNRHAPVLFPEHRFEVEELERTLTEAGLVVEHLETFRFSVPPPLGRRTRRLVNRLEQALPPHLLGDIVLAYARKP